MVLSSGFNGPCTFPFTRLIEHVGREEWERREREIDDEEAAAFDARKVLELERYNIDVEKVEARKALVDQGKMTKEEFVVASVDLIHP